MKKLFLGILLGLLGSKQLLAQNNRRLDSLLQVSARYGKEDTVKTKMLYQIALLYRRTDGVKALNYAEEAAQLATQLNNPYWIAHSHALYGDVLAENLKDQPAITAYQTAIRTFEAMGDKRNVGITQNALANLYMKLSDWEKAQAIQTKLLQRFRQEKDAFSEAVMTLNLGVSASLAGKNREALTYFEAAQVIAEKGREKDKRLANFLSACYQKLASTYQMMGNFSKALDYNLKAIHLSEQMDNKPLMSDNYEHMARTYMVIKDRDKAVQYAQKALDIALQLNSPSLILSRYAVLGDVYLNQSSYEKAAEVFGKGHEMGQKSGQTLATALGLSRAYYNLKDYEKAWLFTQETYEKAQARKEQRTLAWAYRQMGGIYCFAPDSVLKKIGVPLTERYQKSIEAYTKSLDLFRKQNSKLEISNRLAELSVVYEKKGDFVKAYEFFKERTQLRDSLHNENVRKQIAQKELQYEFDKKEAEIRFEQQLTAQELEKQKLLTTQQQQALQLKNQALALSEKDRDLQRLAYLQEKAQKQEREQQLQLAEQDKQLQASQLLTLTKEKALQLQTLAKKNALIGFLIASLLGMALAALSWYLWQRQKRLKQEKENSMYFTKQLLQNTEEERRRIASDLHDSISHELLTLKSLFQQDISTVNGKIDTIINDVRSISRNLHPVMFDKIGLVPNVEALVERLQNQNDFMVSTDMEYEGTLSSSDELQLYRIIQEALSNIIKYAKAHAAKVTLQQTGHAIQLEIKDNGRGFDVQKALNSGKAFGLHNIIERARAIGGKAHIESSAQGTIITITIKNSPIGG